MGKLSLFLLNSFVFLFYWKKGLPRGNRRGGTGLWIREWAQVAANRVSLDLILSFCDLGRRLVLFPFQPTSSVFLLFVSFCYLTPTLICLMCACFLSSPCMATYFNFRLFHVSLHFNVCHVIAYFDFVSCYVLLCIFVCFNFSLFHALLFNCYLLIYFVWQIYRKYQKKEKRRKLNTSSTYCFILFWYE